MEQSTSTEPRYLKEGKTEWMRKDHRQDYVDVIADAMVGDEIGVGM